jgi:hypothetical protein
MRPVRRILRKLTAAPDGVLAREGMYNIHNIFQNGSFLSNCLPHCVFLHLTLYLRVSYAYIHQTWCFRSSHRTT